MGRVTVRRKCSNSGSVKGADDTLDLNFDSSFVTFCFVTNHR